MQPHRSRYWLNANPLDPEVFREQAEAVCDLYERAGALAERGIHVVSVDVSDGKIAITFKPGVQNAFVNAIEVIPADEN